VPLPGLQRRAPGDLKIWDAVMMLSKVGTAGEADRLLDPTNPVMVAFDADGRLSSAPARQSQRLRRSVILAAIRQLLVEEGHKGVTVRRIAEISGYVVQTVYNLVGPRDHAIVEAILDYTLYVGSFAPPSAEDPLALVRSIEWQGQSILRTPEFTRHVCQINFTDSRHIFWNYRERQIRNIHSLIVRQKRNGIMRRDLDCKNFARDVMLLSAAICIDWSDGYLADDELIPHLISGYSHMLAGALSPKFSGIAMVF
jgi:AcrR family transcriptional regulator